MHSILPLLSLLFGCAEPVVQKPTHLTEGSVGEASQLYGLPNNANGNLMATVTDENGFALPNQTIQFTIEGDTVDVTSDAFGIAILEVDSTTDTFGTASWNGQSVPVQGVQQESLPSIVGYEAWAITPNNPDALAYSVTPATDGALYAYDNELWWLSERSGALPQFTGSTNGPVLGMDSGHIDGDGVLDAVVFTSTEVYLLRGRPYGGFALLNSWLISEEYANHSVISATINHLNDDAHGDVAVASSSGEETLVSVLDGDGSWGFTARPLLFQGYASTSMVAGDENNDQFADVTLIDDEGVVRRFSYSIEGWIGGFPSVIDPASFVSLPGATLGKPVDLNGDGNQDTLIYDGEGSSTQDLVFFTIGETITKYSQNYRPYYGTTYDVDQNGSMDVLSLSDEFLHLTYLVEETGAFAVRNLNTISTQGPLQVRDFNQDGWADINVFSTNPIRIKGTSGEEGKWTPERVRWKEESGISIFDNLWAVGNVDADDDIEVGFIVEAGGEKRLQVWRYGDDFTALSVVADFGLGNTEISDFGICNGDYFLISDTGTAKQIRQLQLNNDAISTKRRADVEQDYFECTLIDGLNHFLLWGGTSSYIVLQQTFVSIGAGDANEWEDADIGAVENGQTHTVRGCTETDCQVRFADLDNDSNDELIVSNSQGITVSDLANEDIQMTVQGVLSTIDIDGNNTEELVITQSDGWAWVYHATGFDWSAVQGIWMDKSVEGNATILDVNGDGLLEVIHASSTGTLLTSDDRTGG